MVPGTEVLAAPGWIIPPVSGGFIPRVLRLVLESEPVPDPMPVVVVGRLPGTDEMPGAGICRCRADQRHAVGAGRGADLSTRRGPRALREYGRGCADQGHRNERGKMQSVSHNGAPTSAPRQRSPPPAVPAALREPGSR